MSTTIRSFSDLINFSRGSGKTRTNAAGLIVGVDFSSTSNTITTGSKTFTLAADLNVNRDWATGSSVRAVDQVGGGAMVGTVTSYTPSTQALVIEVTSVTGSGTSTNWRIGTLEITRDALTGAVSSESAATNLVTFSEQFENAVFTKFRSTLLSNVTLSPDGSVNADKIQEDNTATATHGLFFGAPVVSGATYAFSCYLKSAGRSIPAFRTNIRGAENDAALFDLSLVTATAVNGSDSAQIISVGGGWYRCIVLVTSTVTQSGLFIINTSSAAGTNGDGTSGIFIWGAQLELNAPTSYIPTTTAQVTRAADSFALTSTAINSIRQGQGTLYVEAESADVGPTQKRAIRLSGLTGDIRLAKRGVGNFSGFTKMLEVDNDLYFGASVGNSQRCNGKEMGSFSAVNERDNLIVTQSLVSALAYDGTSTFLVANGTTEEVSFTKNLSLRSNRGFGGVQLNGGTYTGTRFIFSTGIGNSIFLSNDGLTYRRVNTPVIAQATNEVTSGLVGGTNRVVIVGNAGFIATSDDQGETWTSRVSGVANTLHGVTFAQGLFLVCTDATANNVRTSTDGITWAAQTTSATQIQRDIAYNGSDRVVTVGHNGSIQTATISGGVLGAWSNATLSPTTTQILRGIHFANGLWVAVGEGGVIYTSTNGTSFSQQSSGTTNVLNEVNYFNNTWIAVGSIETVLTSPNATTWTARNSNVSSTLHGIAASPTRVVVTGSNGAVTTSEDALTYTSRTNNAVPISGMAFGNGVFVSVGNSTGGSGYIATIDAAGNYTRRVSGNTSNFHAVRFFSGLFIAVGNVADQSISTSTDAVTWVKRLVSGQNPLFDVAFGAGVYVAVGSLGRYTTSSDGTNWSANTATGVTTQQLNGIAFANNLFVSVGNAGTIITSPNGTTWTLRTSGTTQQLNSVMYSTRDQLWYAAGNAGTLLFSSDAITWQSVQNAGFASIDNSGHKAAVSTRQWKDGKNTLVVSYKNNEVYTSINGFAAESDRDNSSSIPEITSGFIGENFNGLIHKVRFDPRGYSQSDTSRVSIGGVADFGSNSLSANTLGDEISVNSSGDTLNA